MTFVAEEIRSQPRLWRRAAALAAEWRELLPAPGARVAFIGCGTSWFIAQALAAAREAAGHGESDAFAASEMPSGRRYDLVVALSRSGTTTEVLELIDELESPQPVLAVTADASSPLGHRAGQTLAMPFADERSVVQTRFATCTMALFRAHFGAALEPVAADAERTLSAPAPVELGSIRQLVFLGRRASIGLAQEAALKVREAAQSWSEAYPAMEYRHGPISVAEPGTVVWSLDALPPRLGDEIRATGAALIEPQGDPMVELVRAQQLAVALAESRGLDPDHPRNLTRSVVLQGDSPGQ